MKRLLMLVSTALLVSACSQAPVSLAPQRRTAQDDAAFYATATRGGLYVGAATSRDGFVNATPVVEKVSRSGRPGWLRTLAPSPGDDYAELTGLEHGPDGSVYAAYTSVKVVASGEFDERVETRFLRRYTPAGALSWTRDVSALNPQAFGYDALGNLYFAARPGTRYELVKYAPNGTQRWRRALEVGNIWDFEVLPDGSSRLLDRTSFETGRVLSFDAQGKKLWAAAFSGQAVELAAAPDGSSFVVGYGPSADPAANTNVRLSRYAASGVLAWTRSASGGGYRDLGALAPDGQGGVLVGLSGREGLFSDEDDDVFVSRFSGGGSRVWTKTFASSKNDFLFDVATLGTEYYLVGSTDGGLGRPNRGGSDTFVLRLDRNGSQVWAR